MLAIWCLPFLKPAWTSGSSRFTYCWSLAWRILSITLLVKAKRWRKEQPNSWGPTQKNGPSPLNCKMLRIDTVSILSLQPHFLWTHLIRTDNKLWKMAELKIKSYNILYPCLSLFVSNFFSPLGLSLNAPPNLEQRTPEHAIYKVASTATIEHIDWPWWIDLLKEKHLLEQILFKNKNHEWTQWTYYHNSVLKVMFLLWGLTRISGLDFKKLFYAQNAKSKHGQP